MGKDWNFWGDDSPNICGELVLYNKYECACLRAENHEGPCEPVMYKAALLDGVEHCCRVPLGTEHRMTCWKMYPKYPSDG